MFLYAGVVKAGASESFFITLLPFAFVPQWGLWVVAFGLPYVEVATGILLLVPTTERVGAVLVCGLCVVFMGAILIALVNGIVVACGCFGEEDEVPSRARMLMVVARNALVFLSAAWLALGSKKS